MRNNIGSKDARIPGVKRKTRLYPTAAAMPQYDWLRDVVYFVVHFTGQARCGVQPN